MAGVRRSHTLSSNIVGEFRRAIQGIKRRSLHGLRKGAHVIVRRSKELTPVDTGLLRSSHRIETFRSHRGAFAIINVDAPYAAYVHEDLTMNHPNGGQAKFLEAAINQTSSEVLQIIQESAHLKHHR